MDSCTAENSCLGAFPRWPLKELNWDFVPQRDRSNWQNVVSLSQLVETDTWKACCFVTLCLVRRLWSIIYSTTSDEFLVLCIIVLTPHSSHPPSFILLLYRLLFPWSYETTYLPMHSSHSSLTERQTHTHKWPDSW